VCFAATLAGLFLFTSSAEAYPWMIRHEYSGCVPCHADPTGGGLLTEYGRAQGDILLRTRYGGGEEAQEPTAASGFLFGLVAPPEWLLLGGTVRGLELVNKVETQPWTHRFIEMQADLRAQVTAGRFRAYGSIGYNHEGALPAAIVVLDKTNQQDSIVSREHWLGVDLGEDSQFLLRAGRINMPFGIRQIEHTLWVRGGTRTDINQAQQYGVALSYSGDKFRGELMGIAGNYVVNPDVYRERGYSGFLEYLAAPKVAVGVSSLLTYAGRDAQLQEQHFLRSAHGLFVRASPVGPLVLLGEGDVLVNVPEVTNEGSPVVGYAAELQADLEIVQGVHAIVTGESRSLGQPGSTPDWGAWLSAAWFFAPHADFRIDAVEQQVWTPGGPTPGGGPPMPAGHLNVFSLLGQFHIYL
jgi:hypothetical protein